MNWDAQEPHLHTVTKKEVKQIKRAAKLHARRREALTLFAARYRHRPESRRAMLGGLHRLTMTFSAGQDDETTFPWEILTTASQTQAVWDSVAARYARRTVVKDASSLRVMLGFCRDVGLITAEECRAARDFDTKNGGAHRPPAGRYLSPADVDALAHTIHDGRGSDNTRLRDMALLLVLASSAVRGDELSHIALSELDLNSPVVHLTHVKGAQPRDAYLHPHAASALQSWLEIRGRRPGPLFVPLSRTGRPMHDKGRLSAQQVRKVIRRRAEEAGIGHVTTHDLRRFVISQLLTHHDVVLVAGIVGHTNPGTTAIYDRRPAAQQAAAVATLELPFPGT